MKGFLETLDRPALAIAAIPQQASGDLYRAYLAVVNRVIERQSQCGVRKGIKHSLATILRRVAMEWGVSEYKLLSRDRRAEFILPRHAAMWLARQLTQAATPQIARFFHRRDHTTVLYACGSIEEQMSFNQDLRLQMATLQVELQAMLKQRIP